jgi:hypothetical protein
MKKGKERRDAARPDRRRVPRGGRRRSDATEQEHEIIERVLPRLPQRPGEPPRRK